MGLTIGINGSKAVMARLDEAVRAVGSPKEALADSGDFLIREFKANFPTEGRRLGEPWAALAASTLREKQRLGYGSKGILVRTGRLMNAFAKEVSPFMVRVFNPTKYYPYHQLGGPNLPKRRMIIATENVKAGIYEVFNKYIREHLK